MFKTSLIPLLLSILFFYIISIGQPLNFLTNRLDQQITDIFRINWLVLLPALLILILAFFRIEIKLSMLLSIITAGLIAIFLQQQNLIKLLDYAVLGYKLEKISPLQAILQGGGLISMWKPSLVVFISCSLAGIFDGTNMLKGIENRLLKASSRIDLFLYTLLVSLITAALGSNQSISIVLTNQLMQKSYQSKAISNYELAVDIENSSVLLAALIPWNIAALVPTVTMQVSSAGFVPYAFYLYLVPLSVFAYLKIFKLIDKNTPTNMGV